MPKFIWLGLFIPVLLASCTGGDGSTSGFPVLPLKKTVHHSANSVSGGVTGAIPTTTSSGTSNVSPTPTPSTSPTPSPTPGITVTSVNVTAPQSLFVTLYPAPQDPTQGLNLGPNQTQMSAYTVLSNQATGSVQWIDRSNGNLNVTASGSVSVAPSASPGLYSVRAQSVDDSTKYVDVGVLVQTTGELDVTVQ